MNDTFVYKWTHIPTGLYYIGIHKGHVDDGYIVSGVAFNRKWKNTDIEDWHRDILYEGTNSDCKKKEAELVSKETLRDPDCLNLIPGGRYVGKRKSGYTSNDRSYRTKPQQVTLDGITYITRMYAIKQLGISFEELDRRLIQAGWHKFCAYNFANRS
jgi:hypothetical protein